MRVFNESSLTSITSASSATKRKKKKEVCHEFVKLPLSWQAKKKLSKLLSIIRHKVFREIKKEYGELESKQIRANVFLPKYLGVTKFEDIKLFIPDYFRVNMNYDREWDIEFPLKRGSTGVTFVDGKPRYTKRISRRAGEWESKLKMTKKIKEMVHKDLKWIFSIPLIDPFDRNVILGVMNIDGLDSVIEENVINGAILKVSMDLHAFRVYLSERKRKIITFK